MHHRLSEEQELLLTPFERNIEVWRQLWRVLERSHLIVQIVDARNPLRFRCEDLESYVLDIEGPEGERGTCTSDFQRKNLLLINKADLLTGEQRWIHSIRFKNIFWLVFDFIDDNGRIILISRVLHMHFSQLLMLPHCNKQDESERKC